MKVQTYRDLIAWQRAMQLATAVYHATRSFPKDELYGMTAQMRRAVVSVASNIAEGQGRQTAGEFRQFLGHARGSLLEVETQVLLAEQLQYLSKREAEELLKLTGETGRILNGLMNSLEGETHRRAVGAN